MRKYLFPILLVVLAAAGCDNANTPLDADTRQLIDSIASAQMVQARKEVDSLCKDQRTTLLPHLIDSIRQQRMREIQEQLKTVPK